MALKKSALRQPQRGLEMRLVASQGSQRAAEKFQLSPQLGVLFQPRFDGFLLRSIQGIQQITDQLFAHGSGCHEEGWLCIQASFSFKIAE